MRTMTTAAALLLSIVGNAGAQQAQSEFGSAAEAKAMLENVVASMKTDQPKLSLKSTKEKVASETVTYIPSAPGQTERTLLILIPPASA